PSASGIPAWVTASKSCTAILALSGPWPLVLMVKFLPVAAKIEQSAPGMSTPASLSTSWKGTRIGFDLLPSVLMVIYLPAVVMIRRFISGIRTPAAASKSCMDILIAYGPLLFSPVPGFLLVPAKMIPCASGRFLVGNASRHYKDTAPA